MPQEQDRNPPHLYQRIEQIDEPGHLPAIVLIAGEQVRDVVEDDDCSAGFRYRVAQQFESLGFLQIPVTIERSKLVADPAAKAGKI